MNNSTCPNSVLFEKSFKQAEQLVIFKVIVPLYLIFGLFGHISLLIAVYKRSKTERAYFYQVARAVAETLEVVIRSLYCLHDSVWLADEFYIPPSISSCYGCIWFAARLLVFLANAVLTLTLFLSVCMVADRVFALTSPIAYRSINRRIHEGAAMIVSMLLSILLAFVDVFRFDVTEPSPGTYSYEINKAFLGSSTVYWLGVCRVGGQAALFLILVFLSVTLICLYHRRFAKTTTGAETHAQEKRKQEEKTLIVLTLLECTFNAMGIFVVMTSLLLVYVFPNVYLCIKQVFAPLVDATCMIVDVADFYTALVVSKKFRQMVRKVFMCGKTNVISVVPARSRSGL